MSEVPYRRVLGAALGCLLLLAACGGGEDDPGDGTPATTAASQPSTTAAPTTAAAGTEAPAATTAAPADPGGGGGDANQVVVTIDGVPYEFDVEMSIVGRCDPDFFGAFWVIAGAADGSSSSLEMFLVPEGNSNHDETSRLSVNLKDAEGRDWNADEDGGQGVTAGTSQIDSFSIDGNSVTGTASFVDIYAGDDATAQGTFTATCP
jgi:hypothetical protein